MSSYFPLIEKPNFTLEIEESSSKYNLDLRYDNEDDTGDWLPIFHRLTSHNLQSLKDLFNGDIGDTTFFMSIKNSTTFTIKEGNVLEIIYEYTGLPDRTLTLNETYVLKEVNDTLRHLIEDHFNGAW